MQVKGRLWSRKVKLLEQFGPARITNVPPLPAKIARALYSEAEDDAEGSNTSWPPRLGRAPCPHNW